MLGEQESGTARLREAVALGQVCEPGWGWR
jgi:hypothetical protein